MKFYLYKREYGAEQPYWGGPLKLRVPFIHYPMEWADFIQGAILAVVPMGIIAAMTKYLGIPFDIAITMVIINNFLYLLHTSFGDPAVAGWITAGIPLYIGYLLQFPMGPERLKALIAFQLVVGAIFLILGGFGIAKRVVSIVPASIKSGILLGAGLASVIRIFKPGSFFSEMPISLTISILFSFFMLFSRRALKLREQYGIFRWIAQYGIAPAFVVGYIVGLIVKEVKPPVIKWGLVHWDISGMITKVSALGVGFPSVDLMIKGIPLAIMAYILAFGDVLILESLIDVCNRERPDEKVVFSANRNHIVTAIRNIGEAIFLPFLSLAGPQWTGGQALVVNRYIHSTPEEEPTYWGGATALFWGMSIALCLAIIVTICKPALKIGFALTLAIQGWLCCYLAMEMLEDNIQRGISGVMGSIIAAKPGSALGLGAGIVMFLAIEFMKNGANPIKDKLTNNKKAESPKEESGGETKGEH